MEKNGRLLTLLAGYFVAITKYLGLVAYPMEMYFSQF